MTNWMSRIADSTGFVDMFPVKAETPEEAVLCLISQGYLLGLQEWKPVGEKLPLAGGVVYYCFRSDEWNGVLYVWAVVRKQMKGSARACFELNRLQEKPC